MSDIPPATITAGDLYRELVSMRADVGTALIRLEVIDTRNKGADSLHADHENRLRMLESFRWRLTGIALAVSAASGLVGYLLGSTR